MQNIPDADVFCAANGGFYNSLPDFTLKGISLNPNKPRQHVYHSKTLIKEGDM